MMQANPTIPSRGDLWTTSASDPAIDLDAELWRAIRFARHSTVEPLLGILQLSHRIQWGLARVEYLEGSRAYAPRVDGPDFALITAVVERGELLDLCAIALPSEQVATRLGVGTGLGLDDIDRARWNGTDLRLANRPLEWLRDPVGAAFIIDWKVAAFTLADLGAVKVRCSSPNLADRVRAAFARPLPLPRLLVKAA